MSNDFKAAFLHARDPQQMRRLVGDETRATPMGQKKSDEIPLAVDWWTSVPLNLAKLLDLREVHEKLYGAEFMLPTFIGELHFSRHTTPAEFYGYAERIADAVSRQAD